MWGASLSPTRRLWSRVTNSSGKYICPSFRVDLGRARLVEDGAWTGCRAAFENGIGATLKRSDAYHLDC
jgi:hypothetical protein